MTSLQKIKKELNKLKAALGDPGLPTIEMWRKYHHLPEDEFFKAMGYTPAECDRIRKVKAQVAETLDDFEGVG